MKFFFPDSQDLIDPSFDFERERRSTTRKRQRDDLYAHEVFSSTPFDGFLVSKGIVDGYGALGSRYTLAQRHRLLRLGAPEFFRIDQAPKKLSIMGDCGAFTYVKEEVPPYSVEEVLEFYGNCQFDYGVSLDHIILLFKPEADAPGALRDLVSEELRERRELTLRLAKEFLQKHKAGGYSFEPVGVAQGWSPLSYADSVRALQKMGYRSIALGGMVPLKTNEIIACLEAIHEIRKPGVQFHLLGISRPEHLKTFARLGITSFDSTSPLRQAFKDGKDNYYTPGASYTAIRIPQVEGNPLLQRKVSSGAVSQDVARKLEKACLEVMKLFDEGRRTVEQALAVLMEYERFYDPDSKKGHEAAYRQTLTDAPWRKCPCEVCHELRHHVIIFRGAERNRRRGFHNVWNFYQQLEKKLGFGQGSAA
ncbi:tRNA-guanine transglycosylase DpdA [Corallococcus sp. bb12-1]|uniref:tRNA-guanine transglycosylase DpdA n=1 Tax=Corallococcus sp. bb12-1 TaxID=2996784 RepID=UPI002270901A|nr:tRNA-guanine transglycosylase DpdA [Corallococcus sp. bb12-1]MCY1046709.1 tRNA-guanine transglycosylase DpdA [Corallococcus sp. bb12-1]